MFSKKNIRNIDPATTTWAAMTASEKAARKPSAAFSAQRPMSCNQLIGNLAGAFVLAAAQTTGVLILPAALSCCYLTSDSLSGQDAVGPARGQRHALAKLHLNSGTKGQTIFESVYRPHACISVPPQVLKQLHWGIRDSNNRVLDLKGTHCSWTLCFDQRD